MAWNGLDTTSIIKPGDKLILQVTPPATETPVPLPATDTPKPTRVPATPTLTETTLAPALSETPSAVSPSGISLPAGRITIGATILVVALAAAGLLLVGFLRGRK